MTTEELDVYGAYLQAFTEGVAGKTPPTIHGLIEVEKAAAAALGWDDACPKTGAKRELRSKNDVLTQVKRLVGK